MKQVSFGVSSPGGSAGLAGAGKLALVGGMTYPYLVGLLADGFSLRVSFGMVPLTLICSAILFYSITKRINTPE